MKGFISSFIKLLGLCILCLGCSKKIHENEYNAPLLNNLGDYQIDVTSQSSIAAKFVNQGIVLANAFNHMEAERSFREAVRLDSTCAMGYWGIAYVLGPNYNTGSTLGELDQIREVVNKAVHWSNIVSSWEKALINATVVKFPPQSDTVNMIGYKEAMKNVYEIYKNNDFITTLYAESLMNLHAWDFYTRKGGEIRPWTSEIIGILEHALNLNPRNPLANHLYIHAIESAPDVEKALVCAERLKTLAPGAGHLIHMPSHVYINTGDYHEGSIANEKAVVADSIYIAECQAQGVYPQLYYPHNYHFLSATAALEGRGARSIEAAFKMANIIDTYYLRQPGFETTQHYITVPYNVLVKFAQWEKIIALPQPEDDLKYPYAIWHYARGMAFANSGKIGMAEEELDIVQKFVSDPDLKAMMIWEINSMADIIQIAYHVLHGEISRMKAGYNQSIYHFSKAIEIEDKLNYNEPPDWFFSVRHLLGDVYLTIGEYKNAEDVYREDLSYWVDNGYALNGLYHSLLNQGKDQEAEKISQKFAKAWIYADSKLKFSRIDPQSRENLVIQVDTESPSDLVYLANTLCGF